MTSSTPFSRYGYGLAIAGALCATPLASAQDFPYAHQAPTGNPATFHVTGSATTGDLEGDAILQSVEMAGGERYDYFYRPVAVHEFNVTNNLHSSVRLRGGTRSTEGLRGLLTVADADSSGSSNHVTDADRTAFVEQLRQTMANHNLTNYYDTSSDAGDWSFIIEFDMLVMDNDPEADSHGELLYFERGAGYGNSWLEIQAVDDNFNPIGTPLAIGSTETRATSPAFAVWRADQGIGAVAIDVSRLGVSEFKYLMVRKISSADSGYVSGEKNPDFKFMAVITHPDQLNAIQALYD